MKRRPKKDGSFSHRFFDLRLVLRKNTKGMESRLKNMVCATNDCSAIRHLFFITPLLVGLTKNEAMTGFQSELAPEFFPLPSFCSPPTSLEHVSHPHTPTVHQWWQQVSFTAMTKESTALLISCQTTSRDMALTYTCLSTTINVPLDGRCKAVWVSRGLQK
jgi:hypothetical protein